MSRTKVAFAVAATLLTALGRPSSADDAPPRPTNGCVTFTDPAGDASQFGLAPNDGDLDLLDVVLASPPNLIRAYLHVAKLGAPTVGLGHQFLLNFTLNNKSVAVFVGRDQQDAVDSTHQTLAGTNIIASTSGVRYDGAAVAGAQPTAVYDAAHNTVVLTMARAPIEKAAKTSLADGVTVTGVSAQTSGDYFTTAALADTASAATPAAATYTMGDNHCFEPPHGHLALSVPTDAIAGHALSISGTLTDDQAAGVGGKQVEVGNGTTTVEATTAADGSFTAALATPVATGTVPVTVTWAGDPTLQATSGSGSVNVAKQPTKTTLARLRSGTKSTVRATVVDDLAQPLAGQLVVWYLDKKRVGSNRTDARGVASLTTATGHAVLAVYNGTPTRYVASQRQITS